MRRVILLALLALALPIAALADGFTFTNHGGKLSVAGNNVTLTGSPIVSFSQNGGSVATGSSLGSLSFSTTGGLITNTSTIGSDATKNLQTINTFSFAGGSYTATGNGGAIPTGVLFAGNFGGPTTMTEDIRNTYKNGLVTGSVTHYFFNGTVSGVNGTLLTTQVRLGKGVVSGGNTFTSTSTTTTPEPGTLGLLGTGLVGIAGLIRRKVRMG